MESRKAEMVFADPPYNVKIAGNVSGLGEIQHRDFAMGAGEMTRAQFISFLNTACSLAVRFSTGGSLHFVCMDWRHMGELLTATGDVYSELKNVCCWVKPITGMGALYRSRHEFIFVFKSGHEPHRNNVELGRHGRDRTNVWNYPSPRTPSEEGNLLAMHPTVKPAAMVADAIRDCSARGGIVLDPFLGSGTTVIAAQRTGRRCYGLEIDPMYTDVIVRRWEAFTRDHAVHASSGLTFEQVQEQRKSAA
jgi:DNA modification methylase